MPDPLQSLADISERCRQMQNACNPSKLPTLASDVAELAEIVAGLVRKGESRPRMRIEDMEVASVESPGPKHFECRGCGRVPCHCLPVATLAEAVEDILRVDHDDMPNEVVDKVNRLLKQRGLEFVDDEQDHEGFMEYRLKEIP